ncbi:hypothetical protein [Paenibacillus sp. FSL H3-0333]|uniref:hypothetical protein n=1 Tax=Paenibacillus sp. FSL H3-0333 TaxID=2921373 RepID=UPI0030F63048
MLELKSILTIGNGFDFEIRIVSNNDFNNIEITPGYTPDFHIVYVCETTMNIKTNSYRALYWMSNVNLYALNWKLA